MTHDKWLSSQDVADTLRVSVGTVRSWITRKHMPAPDVRAKKFTRWKESTLTEFFEDPIKWRHQHSKS